MDQITRGITGLDSVPTRTIVDPAEHARFVDVFQKLIDALPEQIALVDEHWVILAVNPSWTKTSALYGYEALCPGTNYAHFCEARANEGHNAARPAVEGIAAIDAGLRQSFHYVYDGNDRWEGHTFRLAINRLSIDGRTLATITRYDVTELVQLRRQREDIESMLVGRQESERRRVARDLHDSTQQMLVSASLTVGQLRRANKNKGAEKVFSELQQTLDDVQLEIRSIAYLAHPPALENLGLPDALNELMAGFGRRAGLTTSFRSEGYDIATWPVAETALYRIVQEALSNVHRHARATKLDVGLFCRKLMIHTVIVDDGIGIPSVLSSGVGLAGMRQRAADLGGRLFVRAQHQGTAIIASVPRYPRIRAVGDLSR